MAFWTRIHIISPENKFKIIWDGMMIFINVLFFYIIPIQMSFDFIFIDYYIKEKNVQYFISSFFCIIFLFDMLLKFFTGFYENGIAVVQKEKVFKNYIVSHLSFDIIAFLPIFLQAIFIADNKDIGHYSKLVKYSGFLFFLRIFEVFF